MLDIYFNQQMSFKICWNFKIFYFFSKELSFKPEYLLVYITLIHLFATKLSNKVKTKVWQSAINYFRLSAYHTDILRCIFCKATSKEKRNIYSKTGKHVQITVGNSNQFVRVFSKERERDLSFQPNETNRFFALPDRRHL